MQIYVQVIPHSSRNRIIEISRGEYKVWLTAAPVDGKANVELIRSLSEYFSVSKRCVQIRGGATARKKLVNIDGI